MTKYDAFGAPITETIHEIDYYSYAPSTYTQPGESYVRCVCGWEGESVASIGGPAESTGAMFQAHLDDVEDDA